MYHRGKKKKVIMHRFFKHLLGIVFTAFLTCYASAAVADGFSVTALPAPVGSRYYVEFQLSAAGTFNVNCGDGGTLSGTGVSGNVITRNNTTPATYTCAYGSAAQKTITFTGTATDYAETAAISFKGSRSSAIRGIQGRFWEVFPWYISGSVKAPIYKETFSGCSNLSGTIPSDLFYPSTSGYVGPSFTHMFEKTFYGTGNIVIGPGLFTAAAGLSTYMFDHTFANSGVTFSSSGRIFPNDVSSNSYGNNHWDFNHAEYAYYGTFENCSNITSVPNIFPNVGRGAKHMFDSTFHNCTNLTTLADNLFGFFDDTYDADFMFKHTFANTGLTYAGISGKTYSLFRVGRGADSMFYATFAGCSDLHSLPNNLFAISNTFGIEGSANGIFYRTFSRSYTGSGENIQIYRNCGLSGNNAIPAGLFPAGRDAYAYYHTFEGCTGLTQVNNAIFTNIGHITVEDADDYEHMFEGLFQNCTGLTTVTGDLFSTVSGMSRYLFAHAFENTGLTSVPANLFSGITNSTNGNPAAMFYRTFASINSSELTLPAGLFKVNKVGSSMFQETFADSSAVKHVGALFTSTVSATYGTSSDTLTKNRYAGSGFKAMFKNSGLITIDSPRALPVVSTSGSDYPVPSLFYETFANCTSLNTVPDSLFNVTSIGRMAFYKTFYGDTALQTVGNIFANTVSGSMADGQDFANFGGYSRSAFESMYESSGVRTVSARALPVVNTATSGYAVNFPIPYLFKRTFAECPYLSSVPAGIFDVASVGYGAFQETFLNDTSLHSVGALFANEVSTYYDSNHGDDNLRDSHYTFKSMFEGSGVQTVTAGTLPTIKNNSGLGRFMFYRTFADSSITSTTSNLLPVSLFNFQSKQPKKGIFKETFAGCSNLHTVPSTLFSGLRGIPAESMFEGTFASTDTNDCGLTSLPDNLLRTADSTGISGAPAKSMFKNTFKGCSNMEGVLSPTMFQEIRGAPADNMFAHTFRNCSSLTGHIPNRLSLEDGWHGLFENISGTAKPYMFAGTFAGCSGLTGAIPDLLFEGITGAPAEAAFSQTFYGCSGLTGRIPEYLFSGLSGFMSDNAFYQTFAYCYGLERYVSPGLFASITKSNIANGMNQIFLNSGLATSCTPYGLTTYTTGFESAWNGKVSCFGPHITFTLNDNGGSGGDDTLILDYGEHWGITPLQGVGWQTTVTVPTRGTGTFGQNYTFRGYYGTQLSPVTSTTTGTSGQIVPKSGNLPNPSIDLTAITTNNPNAYQQTSTLYAAWAAPCPNVVSHGSCTLNVAENGDVTYTTRCDVGWKLRAGTEGTNNPICDIKPYIITMDHNGANNGSPDVIYSHYDDDFYTGYAPANGGTFSGPIARLNRTPSRRGYAFAGYFISVDSLNAGGGGNTPADRGGNDRAGGNEATEWIEFIDSDGVIQLTTLNITQDVTAIARWTPNVYTITLNHSGATTHGTLDVVYLRYGNGYYSTYSGAQTADSGYRIYAMKPVPTKTGFSFAGYYTSSSQQGGSTRGVGGSIPGNIDVGDEIVNANNVFNTDYTILANDTTITAQWVSGIYPIVLDSNNATLDAAPDQVFLKYNVGFYSDINGTTSISTLTRAPRRVGYTFGGFYSGECDSNGNCSGVQIISPTGTGTFNSNYTFTSDAATIYAKWTPLIVRIDLDDTPGSGGAPNPIYMKYGVGYYRNSTASGAKLRNLDATPTRQGYDFDGYYYFTGGATRGGNDTGTGTTNTLIEIINSSGSISESNTFTKEDTAIGARWIEGCNSVTLNPGGGTAGAVTTLYRRTGSAAWYTDSSCTNEYTVPEEMAITPIQPRRAGYTFRGFHASQYSPVESDNSSPLTPVISPNSHIGSYGATPAVAGPVTIYAAWARNCAQTQYDHGTCVLHVDENTGAVVYMITPVQGYSVTSGDHTYNPTFGPNRLYINLNKNGGSGLCGGQSGTTTGVQICTYDDQCDVPNWNELDCNIANGTTLLTGWNTESDGSGDQYKLGDNITNIIDNGSITLYATWAQPTCDVTLGTGVPANTVGNAPTCAVKCNNGYGVSGTYSGVQNTLSYSYECTANNIGLIWENGGHGGLAPTMPNSCTYGAKFTTPGAMTESGYNFTGWQPTGMSTIYPGATVDCDYNTLGVHSGSATLTGQWSPATYTVTYACGTDATGTAPSDSNYTTATYNAPFTAAPNAGTCAKTGHTFAGWRPDGESTNWNNGTWLYTTDKTFTAQWTPNTLTISLDKNGGTGTCGGASAGNEGTLTCTYGQSCSLPTWNSTTCNITNTTRILTGWNAAANGTGASYNLGADITNIIDSGSTTLYATWEQPTCNVTAGSGVPANAASNSPTCTVTCNEGFSTSGTYSGTQNTTSYSYTCTANTITLTWANGGHGSAPTTPVNCTYGQNFTTAAAITGVTGYSFDKWSVNGNTFNANTSIACTNANLGVTSGGATLTATWTPNGYNITLDNANATTNGTGYLYTKYDTGVYMDSNRTLPMSSVTNPITVPQRAYTVTYNAHDGQVSTTSTNTSSVYNFDGYYNAANGNTQYIGLAGLDTSVNGIDMCIWPETSSCDYTPMETLDLNEWSVVYPYGEIIGQSFCSAQNGGSTGNWAYAGSVPGSSVQTAVQNEYTTSGGGINSTGDHCYCKLKAPNSNSSSWVYLGYMPYGGYVTSDCTVQCPLACQAATFGMDNILDNNAQSHAPAFRTMLFSGLSASGMGYITSAGLTAGKGYSSNPHTWYAKWSGGSVTLPTPTYAGYTFDGWYTAATGGTLIGAAEASYTPTANTTLHAQWTPKPYDISYNLNGGSLGNNVTNPASYNITTANFTLNNPTKTGYTFAGWTVTTAPEQWGTGSSSSGATTFTVATGTYGNLAFTATWTPNTNTAYSVCHYLEDLNADTYTLNGGACVSKTGTTAASITVLDETQTFAGFTYNSGFAGTSAAGTSLPAGTPDTTTTILADGSRVISLYYTRNSYTLTLTPAATGIESVTGGGTYEYGASVTINAEVSVGYSWDKWVLVPSYTTTVSTDKQYTFTMPDGNRTYMALATQAAYAMNYTCDEGEAGYTYTGTAPAAQTANYLATAPLGQGVTLPGIGSCKKVYGTQADPEYCDNCFDFVGWKIKAEATALLPQTPAPHEAGSTINTWGQTNNTTWCKIAGVNDDWGSTSGACAGFTDSTPFTIRPVYEPKTYTLSYGHVATTGGTGNRPNAHTYTTPTSISAADLTLQHGSFVGWCADDSTLQNCTSGAAASVGPRNYGNHTYYAKWACDTGYELSYDANDNPVCSAASITCSAGQYLPANATVCDSCPANSYCTGGTYTFNETTPQGVTSTCAAATSNKYNYSASGSSSANDCYLTLTPGKRVASAGAGMTDCTANYFSDDNATHIFYGGTATENHPTTSTCPACSTLGGGLYNKSVSGSASTGCYKAVAAGKYIVNNTDTAITNCPKYYYCVAQTLYWPNVSNPDDPTTPVPAACPAADSTTQMSTYPANYYNPTSVVSFNLTTTTNLKSINECRATYTLNNARGRFAATGVTYNSTTEQYDTGGVVYYARLNPGYYGVGQYYTAAQCNSEISSRRMYYNDAQPCPAGSWCPYSGTLPLCNDANYTYDETFGINSCPVAYPNSAAISTSQNDCYLTLTPGNYVATAGAGTETCVANNYCDSTDNIYYGGTVSGRLTTGGMTACSVGAGSNYTTSVAGSDSNTDCSKVVTLNKNGGSGTIQGVSGTADAYKTCYFNTSCTFGSTTGTNGLTQTGYTFTGGWGNSASCSANATSITVPNETNTYYACKSANVSTVTLNKNTSASDSTVVTTVHATYGQPMPTKDINNNNLTVPTRESADNTSYTFDGYYDARTGGTRYYTAAVASASNWNKTGAQTLYAQWKMTCDAGYYVPAGAFACSSCPAGKYCTGGTAYAYSAGSTQGITGNIAAGYYSAGGASASTGTGMVSGGYYSTGGGTSATPTAAGNGCLNGNTCGKLSAEYYGNGGSTGNSATCVSGQTCGTCDSNYRANTTTGKTAQTQCQTSCGAGQQVAVANAACSTPSGSWYTSAHTVNYGSTSGSAVQSCTTNYATANTTTQSDHNAQDDCKRTITLDKNGGTGTVVASKECSEGVSCALPDASGLTQDGYIFAGTWSTTSGVGASDCVQTVTTPTAGTYYACKGAGNYTISFNANGATSTTGAQLTDVTATFGNPMPAISTTAPVKTGYTFKGWYDNATWNATGAKQYYTAAGASARDWDKTANTTLYAGWENKVYTIVLNDNGGSGGNGNVYVKYNVGWSLTNFGTVLNPAQLTQTPIRSGYTFRGYYSQSDAPADLTANGNTGLQRITKDLTLPASTFYTGDVTVVAGWAQNCTAPSHGSCTLTVENNGNVTYSASCDSGYTLAGNGTSTPTCSPNDYTISLDHANATSNGTTTLYTTKDTAVYRDSARTEEMTTTSNPITKPARTYTIVYNGNNGTVGSLTSANTTSTYTFNGYYSATSGGTQYIDNTGKITSNGITAGIGYTTNGTTWNVRWSGGSVTLPTATRAGYTLNGWWTDATNGTKRGDAGGAYAPTAAETLYAHWTPITFNVTYAANGGSGNAPQSPTQCTYAGSCNAPANTYTKTGYTFANWACSISGGSCAAATYNAGDSISTATTTVSGTILLTAQWTANTYTVEYACGTGATGPAPSDGTATYNAPFTTAGNTCNKTGYEFAGWLPDGENTVWVDTTLWTYTTGKTFTAQWTANDYSITYQLNGGDTISSGYMPVEYIQSSGEQYIDTGHALQTDNVIYEWTARDDNTDGSTSLFGAQGSGSYSGILHGAKTSRRLYVGTTSGRNIGYSSNDSVFHNWRLQLSDNKAQLIKDGTATGTANYNGNAYKDKNVVLFGNRTSTTGAGQRSSLTLKHFRMTDGGTVVFNGIPVLNLNNNKCGLYDTVSGTFLSSGTSTEFTCPSVTNLPATYTYGTGASIDYVPSRANSAFVGWCENAALSTNCVSPQAVSSSATGDKVYYAKWTCNAGYTANNDGTACVANTIALTWANNGHGTAPSTPANCTYGSNFTTAAALTETGYTFDGWSVNSRTFSEAQSIACNELNLGVTSNSATLTAQWTINTFDCAAGTYLPANATSCATCTAGNYCPGVGSVSPATASTYPFNPSADQGIFTCTAGSFCAAGVSAPTACAIGSYTSTTGQSVCSACNNGTTTSAAGQTSCDTDCANASGATVWETATWSSNNTVSNLCIINTCGGGYYPIVNNSGNACSLCADFANGLYPRSPVGGVAVSKVNENYNGDGREACFLYKKDINGYHIAEDYDEEATPCPAGTYTGYGEEHYAAVHYGESYACENCQPNTYSTGGATSCTACATGYTTSGLPGTAVSDCQIHCDGGYYLDSANDSECTAVGAGNWAAASWISQGQTGTYNSCTIGLTTIGYGVGADEAGDCGRVLNIGDGHLYLRSNRKTDRTLNVKIGNNIFYGNMATGNVRMSHGINNQLKAKVGNTIYSIYDDSASN